MLQINKVKAYLSTHKITAGLIVAILIILMGGVSIYKNFNKPQKVILLPDIELNFEAEGPYALMSPRRDGNAINLDITRAGQYDFFAYQIVYTDDQGTERGAGSLDTWIELKNKSDYNQEILLGTCSQGFTSGAAHCVFDKGVENGTLVLRFRKGNQPYKMLTEWHLQKPDMALGTLTSGDSHFTYQLKSDKREELALIAFTVINDLTGVPKLPEGKQVLGKVYSLTAPTATDLKDGIINLETAETPPVDAKLARYSQKDNKWEELDTKVVGSKLNAPVLGSGIFAILISRNGK